MTAKPQVASLDSEATITMLQQELEATNREVLLLTLELEQRVSERTSQLAKANQELIKEIGERMRAEAQIKELNRDLQARAAQLEETNRELEAFSSSVSHDLRAPLTHMIGFASILQDETAATLDEKAGGHLEKVIKSGRRMAGLINDLLRFSHLSYAGLTLEVVDFNELVGSVVSDFEQETEARNITWIVAWLPSVRGDRAMLRQVFVNLISNALKYTRPREVAEIEISLAKHNAHEVIFSVRDNGVGFDSNHANKLFGVFQRLHSDQEFEGTGIGLANVRRIVVRHGGRVWAESKPGAGATFYFSLPAPPEKFKKPNSKKVQAQRLGKS
jgi:light-regulated signal transduction histidine kinase (bacteriophytochrome)